VDVTAEHDSGNSHDPNFTGSIERVNAGNFDCAVEVHHDCSTCLVGYSGLFRNDEGKRLAQAMADRFEEFGIKVSTRPTDSRPELDFLEFTHCPSCIPEMTVVSAIPPETSALMGEAVAAGICDFLGVPYVPEDDMTEEEVRAIVLDVFGLGSDGAAREVADNALGLGDALDDRQEADPRRKAIFDFIKNLQQRSNT
jgi:hypothetical protein